MLLSLGVDLPHRYSVFGASALVKTNERGSIPVMMVMVMVRMIIIL